MLEYHVGGRSDMSDEDAMALSEEEEDYGFDYEDASDEDGEDDEQVSLENCYYAAKGLLDDEPHEALRLFTQVVNTEKQKGDWYLPHPPPSTPFQHGAAKRAGPTEPATRRLKGRSAGDLKPGSRSSSFTSAWATCRR